MRHQPDRGHVHQHAKARDPLALRVHECGEGEATSNRILVSEIVDHAVGRLLCAYAPRLDEDVRTRIG